MPRPVLFVGSFPFKTVEEVFDCAGTSMAGYAKRMPDGEAQGWVHFPGNQLKEAAALEPSGRKGQAQPELPKFDLFQLKSGTSPADVKFPPVGYDTIAKRSYAIFKRYKAEGKIAPDMKFQVSLPTPFAVIAQFIVPEQVKVIVSEYERWLLRDVDAILAAIPHDDLALQWDVAIELTHGLMEWRPGTEGRFSLDYLADTTTRLMNHIPSAVEAGLHFCYGNPGGRHVIEPDDTGLMVRYVNAVVPLIARPVNWVHMPVPIYRDDYAYFAPLQRMRLARETEFYLGLVHLKDGFDGAKRRVDAASPFAPPFGVSFECGFRLFDPKAMPDVLALHRQVADIPYGRERAQRG